MRSIKEYKATFEFSQIWNNKKHINGDYTLTVEAYTITEAIEQAQKQLANYLQTKYHKAGFCIVVMAKGTVKMVIKGKAIFVCHLYNIGEM